MRIVHICLACFYIDGMGYQENLLPKYHAKENEVYIITSDYSFDKYGMKCKKNKKEYKNENGISVKVLEKSKRYGIYSNFRDYKNLYGTLEQLKPDIIFCHGGQFVALMDVIKYCKKNKSVKLYIDQHGDYYNAPVSTIKQRLGHYFIYGYWMRKAVPYVEKFWGVTPWRCQYLNEVYKIPKEKIDLLVMGGDDEMIRFNQKDEIREHIRKEYDIMSDDFLIITGGKIDKEKNVHLIIDALNYIKNEKVKFLVFGQVSKEFEETFKEKLENNNRIRYIGWLPSEKVYDYFLASDLCIFPGTHSVLWEQACSCGLPGIFKYWDGMKHIDIGGNTVFLKEDCVEEIGDTINKIIEDKEQYNKMRVAADYGKKIFHYSEISKKSIGGIV